MTTAPILVIGATGKTGRRVADILQAQGREVRRGSRRSVTPFDWHRPETWLPALEGAGAAYVSYFPDLAYPGAVEAIATLTQTAKRAGVGKLVLLSGRGERHAEACEAIVRDSGLRYTLVRAAWFAQNFSEGYLRDAVLQGGVALPAGDVREPLVDVDDIAAVAAAALTDDRHAGKLYDVTGPRLLSFTEAASILSAATGRTVRYQSLTFAQFRAAMLPVGGAEIADVITAICREVLDGRNAHLGTGVQDALGRPARDFADVCQAAAAEGAWAEAA